MDAMKLFKIGNYCFSSFFHLGVNRVGTVLTESKLILGTK